MKSDFAPASSKEFLDIQATIECGLTLKRVRDMIKTYSQLKSDLFIRSLIKNQKLPYFLHNFRDCFSEIGSLHIKNKITLDNKVNTPSPTPITP